MTRDERRHPERKRRIYYCDEEKDKLRKSALKVFNIEKNTVEEHK